MIKMSSDARGLVFFSLILATGAGLAGAATIAVPNSSFESPIAPSPFYANPQIDYWQQEPDWTAQESGVFANVTGIDNCDGNQAAFLFVPTNGAALFQDYDSLDYSNVTHAFTATYEVGKSYSMTVAVLGGTNLTFPMKEGTTLELDLYYRDAASNLVTVAATLITNSGFTFSVPNHFLDFQVQTPTVRASDAWANRHIGIRLFAISSPELESSGYWDLDNIRLASSIAPELVGGEWTNGQFTFSLLSEPGFKFDILATTNPVLAASNWTRIGTVTNLTGAVSFSDTGASGPRRFYRAQQVP